MALQFRQTKFAIVSETTEGTPKSPSGASEFIPVQDGMSLAPSFQSLETADLKASIGMSKPIQGLEEPTVSFSEYMRHSGVEGTAPEYGPLLESAFGATVVTNSTERLTTSGSTAGTTAARAIIELASGGSDFARGYPVLIKDGTAGRNYQIRPVYSVSSNTLTLGFNMPYATASGMGCGKAVVYKPANTGHKSLSIWQYLADGGAVQMVAGAKVDEFSFESAAGELINANYSLIGTGFYYNPIEITSSNKYLDFNDGGGEEQAQVATGMYKDPHKLAQAIEDAMNVLTADTVTVTYSDTTGKFTLASTGGTFSLLWNTGTNTANSIGTTLGFSVAANDTGASTYTSDNAYSTLVAPYTPAFDAADPVVAKAGEVLFGAFSDTTCLESPSVSFTISNGLTPINDVCAESGRASQIVSGRTCTVEVSATVDQYDVKAFQRYRENADVSFLYNFGVKQGGNWVAGKCVSLYLPTAVVTSFEIVSDNGLCVLNMTLQSYVDDSGNGEVYLGYV